MQSSRGTKCAMCQSGRAWLPWAVWVYRAPVPSCHHPHAAMWRTRAVACTHQRRQHARRQPRLVERRPETPAPKGGVIIKGGSLDPKGVFKRSAPPFLKTGEKSSESKSSLAHMSAKRASTSSSSRSVSSRIEKPEKVEFKANPPLPPPHDSQVALGGLALTSLNEKKFALVVGKQTAGDGGKKQGLPKTGKTLVAGFAAREWAIKKVCSKFVFCRASVFSRLSFPVPSPLPPCMR